MINPSRSMFLEPYMPQGWRLLPVVISKEIVVSLTRQRVSQDTDAADHDRFELAGTFGSRLLTESVKGERSGSWRATATREGVPLPGLENAIDCMCRDLCYLVAFESQVSRA